MWSVSGTSFSYFRCSHSWVRSFLQDGMFQTLRKILHKQTAELGSLGIVVLNLKILE